MQLSMRAHKMFPRIHLASTGFSHRPRFRLLASMCPILGPFLRSEDLEMLKTIVKRAVRSAGFEIKR